MTPTLLTHLKRLLITWGFCLVIVLVQYGFTPNQGVFVPFVYTMVIGTLSTLSINMLAMAAVASAVDHSEDGWPRGWLGGACIAVGCCIGVVAGVTLSDRYFGWSSWGNWRLLQVTLLISLLSGVAISFYFYARGNREALERQVAQAQLRLLESQLDPHMLFNTLANLRALIGQDPRRAQLMLDHLNRYLRATLSGARTPTHSMANEFARLKDYLELMQIRMGDRLSFTLDLPAHMSDLPMPSLLLQPLVENAIKHGLEPQAKGGHLMVSAAVQGAQIRVEVRDNGPGIDPNPASGFGLTHVRERLASQLGSKAQLTFVANSLGGSSAVLTWRQA